MDLNLRTETYTPAEDHRWLGSKHGTDTAESITLDAATLLAVFPDGRVPSGVVLGKITATGKYGPYAAGASDGREVARGHLFTTQKVKAVDGSNLDSPAALFWHGRVVVAKLPANHGLTAAARTALSQIRYVG